jgi:hypothetical protein
MPAANLLTDDGTIDGMRTDPGGASTLRVGAQDVSTIGDVANADYCNVHVALFALLGVALVVLLRKNGIHALSLEG